MSEKPARPSARIEWDTTITDSYSRVFTPDEMTSLGYTWHEDTSLPDNGEWRLDWDSDRDPADELADCDDDGYLKYTSCNRDVSVPVNERVTEVEQ